MNTIPYAYVDCIGHMAEMGNCGTQPLTYRQYMGQLMRPDSSWRCPRCRAAAYYNDGKSEEAQAAPAAQADAKRVERSLIEAK